MDILFPLRLVWVQGRRSMKMEFAIVMGLIILILVLVFREKKRPKIRVVLQHIIIVPYKRPNRKGACRRVATGIS